MMFKFTQVFAPTFNAKIGRSSGELFKATFHTGIKGTYVSYSVVDLLLLEPNTLVEPKKGDVADVRGYLPVEFCDITVQGKTVRLDEIAVVDDSLLANAAIDDGAIKLIIGTNGINTFDWEITVDPVSRRASILMNPSTTHKEECRCEKVMSAKRPFAKRNFSRRPNVGAVLSADSTEKTVAVNNAKLASGNLYTTVSVDLLQKILPAERVRSLKTLSPVDKVKIRGPRLEQLGDLKHLPTGCSLYLEVGSRSTRVQLDRVAVLSDRNNHLVIGAEFLEKAVEEFIIRSSGNKLQLYRVICSCNEQLPTIDGSHSIPDNGIADNESEGVGVTAPEENVSNELQRNPTDTSGCIPGDESIDINERLNRLINRLMILDSAALDDDNTSIDSDIMSPWSASEITKFEHLHLAKRRLMAFVPTSKNPCKPVVCSECEGTGLNLQAPFLTQWYFESETSPAILVNSEYRHLMQRRRLVPESIRSCRPPDCRTCEGTGMIVRISSANGTCVARIYDVTGDMLDVSVV